MPVLRMPQNGALRTREAERLLVKVRVFLVVVVLIVSLDRCNERIGGETELLRQLLNGVSLLNVTALHQASIHLLDNLDPVVRSRTIVEGEQSRAAMHIELFHKSLWWIPPASCLGQNEEERHQKRAAGI